MQGEPGTSTDSHIGERREGHVTTATNSPAGEAPSTLSLDNSRNGGSMMPAPRAYAELQRLRDVTLASRLTRPIRRGFTAPAVTPNTQSPSPPRQWR
jgi:hypothetical protein